LKNRFLLWIAGFVMLGLAVPLRAEEVSLITQADAAYAKRDDVTQAKIAMITYERAAASDPTTAVDSYWKASRSAWWLGDHAQERSDKLDYFQTGIDDAKKAIALNLDSPDAHFWLGANEGSYGDTKGVMKSLSMVKPIRHEMAEVIRINDHYSGGAAYRVLGVVDYKVPALVGGSKKRAKEELEKALAMGPNDPFTHYYLAEFYKIMGDQAKKNAELDTLRALQVAPDTIPELKMLQAKADRELK
jgi:tetratricopeptide (TPR) repeat protein